MRYLDTDFNEKLSKLTPSKFKKFFNDRGYSGTWEEAYKVIGGKLDDKGTKPKAEDPKP